MNVLRDGYSERGMTQAGKRHDLKTIHWYVLTLPAAGVARRDRVSPARSLDAELSRRKYRGETLFEYFIPSYVGMRRVDGRTVNTKRSLLFNYVSVRSPTEEVFQMRRTLPLYNLLPRISSGSIAHLPYLSDDEVENLCWVAESYSSEPPVYVPNNDRLLKGDRVHITPGYFISMKTKGVVQPGGGHKGVIARIPDYMWAPLSGVKPNEYELIELSTEGKRTYIHLDDDRLREGLHGTLGRYHTPGSVAEKDTHLACEVLRPYGSLRVEMDVMRYKIYPLPLSAYKLLGDEEKFTRLHDTIHGMLSVVKAPQSRALLLMTLYGCTDGTLYQQMTHEMVNPWRGESSPKKSELSLIRRLDDCDRWLRRGIS